MATIGDICAPMLTGESARRFLEFKERVDSMPERELPEGFYDEFEKSEEKSRKFAERQKMILKLKKDGEYGGNGRCSPGHMYSYRMTIRLR